MAVATAMQDHRPGGVSWQPSLLAGFTGAFASQFWFLAFALTAAANVRTLALVEVLFAQAVSYYSFKQPLSARDREIAEALGISAATVKRDWALARASSLAMSR